MKKIILQYIFMTHTIVYAASPLIDAYAMTDSNQTHYLAQWGLQYCLQYDKENVFEPITYNKAFGLRKDVAQGRIDLQRYLDDECLGRVMTTRRFQSCMRIYESDKEYKKEVERIVKKYCKDCK